MASKRLKKEISHQSERSKGNDLDRQTSHRLREAVCDEVKPCTIRIRTWGNATKQLRTRPLHPSQRECESLKGVFELFDSTIFEYFVAPTEEFYQAVLSREGIEILSPSHVRECVRIRAIKISKKNIPVYLGLQGNLFKQMDTADNPSGRLAIYERFKYEQARFEPAEDDFTNDNIVSLLGGVAKDLREAEIVLHPGYGFMADSLILLVAGVTAVKPVAENAGRTGWAWELPFSRFEASFKNGCTLTLETGTGGIGVARKVLRNKSDVLVAETEPGVFELTYLVKRSIGRLTVKVVEYAPLDRIRHVCRKGWQPLDEATLAVFRAGRTEEVIGFGPEGLRQWLVAFQPESMSDLCLLHALYFSGRADKYDEIVRRRQRAEPMAFPDNRREWEVLRETCGVLVYLEQALVLRRAGIKVDTPLKELALKGHTIACTMIAIESARLLK